MTLTIGDYAFSGQNYLTSIRIPKSVTYIGTKALDGKNLSTIKGYNGSVAETYARENFYNFVSIDDEPIPSDTPTPSDTSVPTEPATPTTTPDKTSEFYDVDGTPGITLSDAQKVLKLALGIEHSDISYKLSDAQMCLKIALGIVKI